MPLARQPGLPADVLVLAPAKGRVGQRRDAGATEVHFRVASPPTAHSCFYGVDTPERGKLLAAGMSEEEMRGHLGVDSLRFVSLDGLYRHFEVVAAETDRPVLIYNIPYRTGVNMSNDTLLGLDGNDTLFENQGGKRFVDVSSQVGDHFARLGYGRGAAFADLNNDGALDLVVVAAHVPIMVHRARGVAPGGPDRGPHPARAARSRGDSCDRRVDGGDRQLHPGAGA